MGNTDRNAAIDLEMAAAAVPEPLLGLPSDVRTYNFYQLVELLQKLNAFNPESEDWERTCQLVFSANPSLGFAPADVTDLREFADERLILQTNFFGLTGHSHRCLVLFCSNWSKKIPVVSSGLF